LLKISGAFLVYPAEKLGGAKAFFAQRGAKNGQALEIEIEEVDRHSIVAAENI
jgi:hypothetical protein